MPEPDRVPEFMDQGEIEIVAACETVDVERLGISADHHVSATR
jgi:hypothetical protein